MDTGLLIHEGQVTYESLGLAKVLDLGEAWGSDTGLPIPLGLDMVRRDLGEDVEALMVQSLRDSIQYAFDHEDDALDYALGFGRGIEREDGRKFVRMYVNEDTLDMGSDGRSALVRLFEMAANRGIIDVVPTLDVLQAR